MILPPPTCKVYTPPTLAEAMVEALNPVPQDFWLDPCVGPGAFIDPLRRRGIPKERIIAVDIEPTINLAKTAATLIHGTDFFQWCAVTEHRFSKIVANPPYVAINKLHPHLRRSFASFALGTDRSFTLSSNYWCAFLSACLRLLEEQGNLAFVLPAAWEYALYASDVRQSVFQQFQTVEVHRCLEPLFSEVRDGCVVLLAKGYRKTSERIIRVAHPTAKALIQGITQIDGKTPFAPIPTVAHSDTSGTPFSDLFKITIGCVTGDVKFFLLTESERIQHKLPLCAVRPVVSKARHLIAAQMSKREWNRLHRADERVWMFHPDEQALRFRSVHAYLEHGKRICNLDGYKLSNREPWYRVPEAEEGTGYLSGMTKLGPWISFRSMRHLVATNTLYVVTARSRMKADERCAWGLSLLSTSCRNQFKALARRYPDGLAKLEPHNVGSLRLPPPLRTKNASHIYADTIRLFLAGHVAEAVGIADAFVKQRTTKHHDASAKDAVRCRKLP